MRTGLAGLLGLVGLAVALLAQFALDSWADQSDLHHWIQHGLLFWSGLLVGVVALVLYRRAPSL